MRAATAPYTSSSCGRARSSGTSVTRPELVGTSGRNRILSFVPVRMTRRAAGPYPNRP